MPWGMGGGREKRFFHVGQLKCYLSFLLLIANPTEFNFAVPFSDF